MAHKNRTNISPYKTRASLRAPPGSRSKQQGPSGKTGKHRQPAKIYSRTEAADRLADLFRNHGFPNVDFKTIDSFAHFYELLMEKQKELNITRLVTLKDVGLKHFVDCMMVPQLVELQYPLLDVGTGPGFPGIPLKILNPKDKIILAEGVQKRVDFLKHVRQELDLQNLPIIGRNINPWFFYPVQGVITRAVEDVRNTLQNVIYSLQTGGRVYFMKGPNVDPEIKIAEKEVGEYYELEKDIAYELPETDQKRRLLVYKKIRQAPFPDLEDEPWPGENNPVEAPNAATWKND